MIYKYRPWIIIIINMSSRVC